MAKKKKVATSTVVKTPEIKELEPVSASAIVETEPVSEPETLIALPDPPAFASWDVDSGALNQFRQEHVNWVRGWLKVTGRDKTHFVDGLGNVRQK